MFNLEKAREILGSRELSPYQQNLIQNQFLSGEGIKLPVDSAPIKRIDQADKRKLREHGARFFVVTAEDTIKAQLQAQRRLFLMGKARVIQLKEETPRPVEIAIFADPELFLGRKTFGEQKMNLRDAEQRLLRVSELTKTLAMHTDLNSLMQERQLVERGESPMFLKTATKVEGIEVFVEYSLMTKFEPPAMLVQTGVRLDKVVVPSIFVSKAVPR